MEIFYIIILTIYYILSNFVNECIALQNKTIGALYMPKIYREYRGILNLLTISLFLTGLLIPIFSDSIEWEFTFLSIVIWIFTMIKGISSANNKGK